MLKMFCLYDSKVQAYDKPFYARATGEALRAIADAVADKNTHLNKHPADYTLFECGSFDETTGIVTWNDAKLNLGTCLELADVDARPSPKLTPVAQ